MFVPTPPEILYNVLRFPEKVSEKAHIAFVYGILLTEACLDSAADPKTITKFRWNLRLALDDARLLLEPCDLHIQTLTLLSFHVQELSTPSMSWMMLSTACRMLQIVGLNGRKLDPETHNRRIRFFWTVNAIDKSLALVFGRAPTMMGAMYANVPLIPMQQLLEYQPHISDEDQRNHPEFNSMFGAHFMRTLHLSAKIHSEVWTYLYGKGANFDEVRKGLDEFYTDAEKVNLIFHLALPHYCSDRSIGLQRLLSRRKGLPQPGRAGVDAPRRPQPRFPISLPDRAPHP